MHGFWLGPKAASRGYRLIGFDSVGSTSSEAIRAAGAGDVGEVWFAATEQTAGRGRRGRPWATARGNLAASLLLRPQADPAVAATLGFVAGVALNRALSEAVHPGVPIPVGLDGADAAGTRIALKWPNDVVADGAKLAGILLEAQKLPQGGLAVVVGFGINIASAPEGLPYPATCLAQLQVPASAASLLAALAEHWTDCLDIWNGGRGVADILSLWRGSAAGIGAEVAVQRDGEVVRGIFETIDDSGRLIIRAGDSRRIPITAGDVHFGATSGVPL